MKLELSESGIRDPVAEKRLDFGRIGGAPSGDCSNVMLGSLRSLVLGFDADPRQLERALATHGTLCPEATADDAVVWSAEQEIIDIFTHLTALFRREPDAGSKAQSETEYLHLYLRDIGGRGEQLPVPFVDTLRRALAHYGITDLEPSDDLREALFRVFRSRSHWSQIETPLVSILQRWRDGIEVLGERADDSLRARLDALVSVTEGRFRGLNDLARDVRYRYFERPMLEHAREGTYEEAVGHLEQLASESADSPRDGMQWLVDCPQPLKAFFSGRLPRANDAERAVMLEALTRRFYRIRQVQDLEHIVQDGVDFVRCWYAVDDRRVQLCATHVEYANVPAAISSAIALSNALADDDVDSVLDIYVWREELIDQAKQAEEIRALIAAESITRPFRRIAVSISGPQGGLGIGGVHHFTYRYVDDGAVVIDRRYPGLHPMMGKRMHLWRLDNFDLERVPAAEDVYLFHAVARDNPKDERLYALAEVRDLTPVRNSAGRVVGLPTMERMLSEALAAIRLFQSARPPRRRLHWNRVRLIVWPPIKLGRDEIHAIAHRLGPATRGLGLEKVELTARMRTESGELAEQRLEFSSSGSRGLSLKFGPVPTEPLQPLSRYTQKVVRCRQRGLVYPYELMRMVTPDEGTDSEFPAGSWVEYDLDDAGENLVPVEREPGRNDSNVVAGLVTHHTPKVPEGMTRVVLLGDPSRSMGSLAERECRVINAALKLALEKRVPVEWIAVSAGARIAMDTGTENMDWIALTLRRIIEFTQAGGELNIIVAGINVGAQPYWNAEATMLMHTKRHPDP